jgi:glyoxylase-like metal-dependent hydrolase (beta-lactamase superfamily II)
MLKKLFPLVMLLACLTSISAQQPNPLDAADAAIGAGKIKSLQFTGSGASFAAGQPYTAGGPWPRLNVDSYTATLDYEGARMRLEIVRSVPNPVPQGIAPFQGQQRQVQELSGTLAWNVPQPAPGAAPPAKPLSPLAAPDAVVAERRLLLWSTPHGFVRAAAANNATVRRAGNASEVTFTLDGKHRVVGRLNAQHQVERVQTWIDNAVLGDMLVETRYSGYRDFGGVTFPAEIVQLQGGHPTLELKITDVKANPSVEIAVPASVSKPAAPPAPVQVTAQQVAPGVHYLTGGSHHSVAIDMRDHVVVVEGPQSEARSLAVIAKTKEVIPNKPIRFVVNTHVHFDHSGGLRPFVDEGATVVTHRSNRAFYEKAWAAPRTINPDRLAQSKKRARFQEVGDRGVLSDGSRTIELHRIPSRHNSGILAAYLPAEKILIQVDLYSPLPATAPPPATPNPFSIELADQITRLKLDVAQILALHGPRVTTLEDLNKAIGRTGSAGTQR